MSDLDSLMQQAEAWLQPMDGDEGTCGPHLEYDNAFLDLNKAAEGKPANQWDAGAPPDWRAVREQAEALFDRTRDLRVAVLWLRSVVSLDGAAALIPGLKLVNGLIEQHWDALHPMPDDGDDDPYARANALAALPSMDGLLGEFLGSTLIRLPGVGDIRVRAVEVAMGHLSAREGEAEYAREHLERMLQAAEHEGAGLRDTLQQAQESLKQLGRLMDQHFGSGSASELKPLLDVCAHALVLVPAPEAAVDPGVDEPGAGGDAAPGSGGAAAPKAGLSGSVTSRAEAIRAIELVCAYLERHEPTNPAQLFLRRASMLLERNFLELLKELAPNALDDVARIVGVDPNTVGESES